MKYHSSITWYLKVTWLEKIGRFWRGHHSLKEWSTTWWKMRRFIIEKFLFFLKINHCYSTARFKNFSGAKTWIQSMQEWTNQIAWFKFPILITVSQISLFIRDHSWSFLKNMILGMLLSWFSDIFRNSTNSDTLKVPSYDSKKFSVSSCPSKISQSYLILMTWWCFRC